MKRRLACLLGIVSTAAILATGVALATRSRGGEGPRTLRALYGLAAPERLVPAHTALVLVDFQDEFFHGGLHLTGAEVALEHAVELAHWARGAGITVVHVRNVGKRANSPLFAPGSPTVEIVPALTPRGTELVLEKSMLGAFSRTDLDARLRARGIDTLVVAGLMTHLAVSVTAADATVLGYRVVVAADAVATRALPGAGGLAGVDAGVLQRATLAALADRVADVMCTNAILALPLES